MTFAQLFSICILPGQEFRFQSALSKYLYELKYHKRICFFPLVSQFDIIIHEYSIFFLRKDPFSLRINIHGKKKIA